MEVKPNPQIEPQSQVTKTHLWAEQDDERNEEEVGVSLVPRHSHSKRRTQGVATTATTSSLSPSSSLTSENEAKPAGLFPTRNAPASSEHSDQEEGKEEVSADDSQRSEVMEDEEEEDKVVKEGDGIRNSVYFDQLQGTEPINGVSEIIKSVINHQNFSGLSLVPVEHSHEDTGASFKHSGHATKVDAHVNLIEEIEEDLVELDVEGVLKKQNTHDLYCPNCKSCITRRVILRRRKPKVPYVSRKSKVGNKSETIPSSVAAAAGLPEIGAHVSPTPSPAMQNTDKEPGQEAFSCLSCFSLFIPTGNGCFKIFNIFRHGKKQSDSTQSPQQTSQRKETQGPQSPPTVSQAQVTQSPPTISQAEVTQSPSKIGHVGEEQSPSEMSHNEDTQQSAQKSEHISSNEGTQSYLSINQNESKQSPEKVPGGKTNWISSIFSLYKGKATVATGDKDTPDLEVGLDEPALSPSTEVTPSPQTRTENEREGSDAGEAHDWEILKSIVYGGLIESITSLGIVSSAAGAGADTLNILVLGMANLIGGLLVIIHNLKELKNEQPRRTSTEINNEDDQYEVQLGRRQNFVLHMIVAILSFLVFGLVPPVAYGFSFRKSDDKDLKLVAVAGASLLCIFLLALGKGHVKRPQRAYFSTVSYYVGLGIMTSGISVVIGELFRKLLVQLGLFDSTSAVSVPFLGTIPEVGRSAY